MVGPKNAKAFHATALKVPASDVDAIAAALQSPPSLCIALCTLARLLISAPSPDRGHLRPPYSQEPLRVLVVICCGGQWGCAAEVVVEERRPWRATPNWVSKWTLGGEGEEWGVNGKHRVSRASRRMQNCGTLRSPSMPNCRIDHVFWANF
jgi:hypothetical protein